MKARRPRGNVVNYTDVPGQAAAGATSAPPRIWYNVRMKNIVGSTIRIGFLSVAGMLLALAIALCFFLRTRTQGVDTSTEMRSLRFYRSGAEWFADVPQHTQAENQMVAGADTLLDEVSGGSDEVKVVISSDIANPSEWKLHLHLVEHDKYGATYKVVAAGREGFHLAWLCNVAHTVFGGEHPKDIYVHSISTKSTSISP